MLKEILLRVIKEEIFSRYHLYKSKFWYIKFAKERWKVITLRWFFI